MTEVFAGRRHRRAQQERRQHGEVWRDSIQTTGMAWYRSLPSFVLGQTCARRDATSCEKSTPSRMLKTSGAREASRIQQRWGEDTSESSPAPGRPAKHLGAKVCSTKRVLLELFVFVVLLLWVILIAFNLASRMEPCQLTRSTVRGDLGNRFIHLK